MPASVARRALAALVDAMIALLGLGGFLAVRAMRDKRGAGWLDPDPAGRSRWWSPTHWGWTLGLGVLVSYRTPGDRLAGIRVVNARTGKPVSIPRGILRSLFITALRMLTKSLTAPDIKRIRQKKDAAQPEIDALERAHPDDPDAVAQGVIALQERDDISCLAPILKTLGLRLLYTAPALRSSLRQGLADRLAGTAVIRDR